VGVSVVSLRGEPETHPVKNEPDAFIVFLQIQGAVSDE
jgi:hypothetical protein